jgi:hypothetical protein
MKEPLRDPEARYRQKMRTMTPEEGVRRMGQMASFVRNCARAGIRAAHPEWSDCEVQLELFRRLYEGEISDQQMEFMRGRIIAWFETNGSR